MSLICDNLKFTKASMFNVYRYSNIGMKNLDLYTWLKLENVKIQVELLTYSNSLLEIFNR
jgi:hypothetical protein